MDNGTVKQFKFSMAILETEKDRLERLAKYLPDGAILNRVYEKKASVHKAILKLQDKPCDIYIDSIDHSYAITILRHNLNWLNRQSHVGDTQDVIDEINEVSNILTTKT